MTGLYLHARAAAWRLAGPPLRRGGRRLGRWLLVPAVVLWLAAPTVGRRAAFWLAVLARLAWSLHRRNAARRRRAGHSAAPVVTVMVPAPRPVARPARKPRRDRPDRKLEALTRDASSRLERIAERLEGR